MASAGWMSGPSPGRLVRYGVVDAWTGGGTMNSEHARASRADGSLPSGRRQPRRGRVRASAVANVLGSDIDLPGWMERVEAMKQQRMEPLGKIATRSLAPSCLQLEGLPSDDGPHVEKGFVAGVRSKAHRQLHLS